MEELTDDMMEWTDRALS